MSATPTDLSSGASSETPMMKQYIAAKARYPRHLLFFRIGDFYEMFYDDARTASRALGLTLTARSKDPGAVPLAGVPVHAVEQYLARLLRMGFSVAICDQTEDAAQAKGIVKRDITRVVTPGTVLEENLLEARKPNRLVAILPNADCGLRIADCRYGLASVDLASGRIFVQELEGEAALRSEIVRLAPSECLVPEEPRCATSSDVAARGTLHSILSVIPAGTAISRLKPAAFEAREAHGRILERFGSHSALGNKGGGEPGSGAEMRTLIKELPLALSAAGALAGYVDETFAGGKVLLSAPQPFDPAEYVALGDSAIRSLELLETLRTRGFEGSLLWSIDRACTGAGSRCLREWLIRPLQNLTEIGRRHDAVGTLAEVYQLRERLRELLKQLADLERIAARLSAERATPRDLLALKESLQLFPQFQELLSQAGHSGKVISIQTAQNDGGLLAAIAKALGGLDGVAQLIAAQLKVDCTNATKEGGLINDGVDAELDRLRSIAKGGKNWIANFQAAEAQRTGIGSLKVGYNRVFGYYIEISRANKKDIPSDYERRQTLTNAERYTTPELKEREAEVLGAEEKIYTLEEQLFLKLRAAVADSAPRLHAAGRALADCDALYSLAEVANRKGHIRPLLSESGNLLLEQMRHPVLEETLAKGDLVPNDLALRATGSDVAASDSTERTGSNIAASGTQQIIILTGPNMAGKSTYIRAGALCVILAQMGAFVPAEKAEIGLVDGIFTRVGAADDLAGGRSTFMLEMSEVAEILAACSSRSLLVLDEVGRGTSTYDGVSLAWSLIEHLHNGAARPRTLFATHYHELATLEEELPRVKNFSAAVREWQGEITFLHRIVPGPSERSFGIHVARLAGLPESLLERAKSILLALEEDGVRRVEDLTDGGAQVFGSGGEGERKVRASRRKPSACDGQLQLFEPGAADIDPGVRALLEQLRAADPHGMTPLQAISALDALVRKAKGL